MALRRLWYALLVGAAQVLASRHFTAQGAFQEWQPTGDAPADASLQLHIGVRHVPEKQAAIRQHALRIADPSGSEYRQHLSTQQLADLLEPPKEARLALSVWLDSHGLNYTNRGDVYEVSTSVWDANRLLSTSYRRYTYEQQSIYRCPSFTLDEEIARFVDFVAPSTFFPRPQITKHDKEELKRREDPTLMSLGERSLDDCSPFVTPSCIRRVYNITLTAAPNRTTFAVYGTEAATFNAADLQTFLSRYNRPAANAKATFKQVGTGDPASGSPGIGPSFETALDTQTSLGTAWPAQAILYNNGGVFGPDTTKGKTYDRFVRFLQELIHNDTVPSVVSFSESMPENQMDPDYARRLCDMMAQVGMRGVTLLFSSGDNGPSGDEPTGRHDRTLETEFPASCPFVTAVGGTTDPENETAATKQTMNGGGLGYWASGGGFSTLFKRPSYQNGAVSDYVSSQIPASYYSKPGFDPSGRGVPDIAALSANLPTVVLGLTFPVGGTSASAPLWAAVVTLLNDYEIAQGRPPMGFLNPWLYSDGVKGLKDITIGGDNTGACILLSGCTLKELYGYNVTVGWDPVTGLGSPNVGKMIEILSAGLRQGRR